MEKAFQSFTVREIPKRLFLNLNFRWPLIRRTVLSPEVKWDEQSN
jgi:hypothetical protein